MKRRIIHDDGMPLRQTAQQFDFKPVFEHGSFHHSAVGVRNKQDSFTLCRSKPDSSIALAAHADIDALPAFTACIAAVHLQIQAFLLECL